MSHHSFCSKAGMLKRWQNILQEEKVAQGEQSSKTSTGCHVFYGKFALFVFTGVLAISREKPEISQGSASQLFPGWWFLAVRLAHQQWPMCTSLTTLPLQLYRTLLVPPLVPVKTRAVTAPASHSGFLLSSFAVSAAGMGKASPWPSWGTGKQGN